MSKTLSSLVNQNTFASSSENLCTQHEYWMEKFCNLFTLCLYSKILVSANIVAADQRVNLCEPPYHRFNYDVNL